MAQICSTREVFQHLPFLCIQRFSVPAESRLFDDMALDKMSNTMRAIGFGKADGFRLASVSLSLENESYYYENLVLAGLPSM